MSNLVRLLCFVLCLAAVTGSTQESANLTPAPSPADIEDRLLNGDSKSVAWAAHDALAAHDQILVPALLDFAARWQPLPKAAPETSLASDQLDQRDAAAAVLDALIQLHASVPAETLRTLASDFPNYVAILLPRLPLEQSQALNLELYHSKPGKLAEHNLQYVSAALLAQAPPAGFVADLFAGIHNRATITITKPGSPVVTELRGGTAGCCLADNPRPDWPQFGIYELSTGKIGESFSILSRPDAVYASRSETTHYRADNCDNFTFLVLGPEERRQFLARMLRIEPDAIGWKVETTDTIAFRSQPQFQRELLRFVASEQKKYRETGSALVARNLMTVSEQQDAIPTLDLDLKDQRAPDSPPLMQPAELPPHILWPKNP